MKNTNTNTNRDIVTKLMSATKTKIRALKNRGYEPLTPMF